MSKYENGLFIFRRDLRVIDNKGLYLANDICKHIYPIFIFTPEQVTGQNHYKSDNCVQFMIESLEDLKSECGNKLLTFYGNNETIIRNLISVLNINVVCFNADYSPYAIERELSIIKMCDKLCVDVHYAHDYYLHEPGSIMNGTGKPYQKFTPYYNAASKKHVDSPLGKRAIHLATTTKHLANSISLTDAMQRFTKENPNILVHGGRTNALKQMRTGLKNVSHYTTTHDDLSKETSQLSAYIKFGCISIREVYKVYRSKTAFIRQLYWRDFYAQILFHFPHVLGHSLKPQYDKIHWHHNANWFKAWCTGSTGFPIVDACMRQMNETGYMHNRGRLIVASFLVKTMLIDWRKGEEYFASKLTDYDVANNNGNWQWVTGNGADAQPYFRIFNPWTQGEEHDSDCEYIKKWIPELTEVPNKDIHKWFSEYINYKTIKYPKPILDYTEQRDKALKMYKDGLY